MTASWLPTNWEVDGFFKITVDQDSYIETLVDVDIPPDRLRQDGILNKAETAACRTALGALQWLAIQCQPQICARCNLLLTEVVTNGTLETARKIQRMIGEVSSSSSSFSRARRSGVMSPHLHG